MQSLSKGMNEYVSLSCVILSEAKDLVLRFAGFFTRSFASLRMTYLYTLQFREVHEQPDNDSTHRRLGLTRCVTPLPCR